jgi:hypothetical protein
LIHVFTTTITMRSCPAVCSCSRGATSFCRKLSPSFFSHHSPCLAGILHLSAATIYYPVVAHCATCSPSPEPQADRRHTYFVYRNLPDSNQTQYPLPHDTGLYRKYTIEWYVLYSVLLFDRTPASGFPLTLVPPAARGSH